jgi:bifunctional ADP-heptose synthase (sugar kinase/adenylyltransferase)
MDIHQQQKFNVLLIGDNCLDIYQYGTVDRLSPEAPVPVFVPTYKIERGGMACNVYNNLVRLGCTVDFISGKQSCKTRLIDQRSKQQILRIDNDVLSEPAKVGSVKNYDAVVISDYAKGTVTYDLIAQVVNDADNKIPVFIDTKFTDLSQMQGAWVKINEVEYSKITSDCSGLIVTKGSKGATVIHHEITIPAPTVEVVDVTGAGDTFLSALCFKYLQVRDIASAVYFANKAASITVQHMGVYAPSLEEIECV